MWKCVVSQAMLWWGVVWYAGQSVAQDVTVTNIAADGPGGTYALLESKLGGSPLEVPDCDHAEPFEHIDEMYDAELERHVFRFYIHKEPDTDRCATAIDRQRNEIKAYDPSPHYLKAIQREEVVYEWYFKMDEGFQPSTAFTHLFQLKAVGGSDDANPLLTLTPRKSDPEQLQLIHGRGSNQYSTVATTDLQPLKGQWLKVWCEAVYAEDTGKLKVQIHLLDGTEVLSYTNERIDMWRLGSTFVRPKWGIYRSLNDAASLRDEVVLFADFTVTETGACPVWYEDADGDGLGDPNNYVFACEKPDGYVQNNRDTCGNWYRDADEDGMGDPQSVLYACHEPEGYVANADDTDDTHNPFLLSADAVKNQYLYPNPAEQFIRLAGATPQTTFVIRDVAGREMMTGRGTAADVSTLQPGMYFLQLENGEAHAFIKK